MKKRLHGGSRQHKQKIRENRNKTRSKTKPRKKEKTAWEARTR